MKSIDEIWVSFYRNVYSKTPKNVSLFSLLEAIVKGRYASQVQMIRHYHLQERPEDAQKLKTSLPCFTASGTFEGAHAVRNLHAHSGVILIDYDHVPDIAAVRNLCAADPHTLTVFQSPTDGVKIAAYVENATGRHREAYQLVSSYYDRLTGLTCDPACKDESRLCYVSHDPQGYLAAIYQAFRLPEELSLAQEQTPYGPTDAFGKSSSEEFVMSYLFLNKPTRGNRNSLLFKLACQACKRGYAENEICSHICRKLQDTDFDAEEIKRTITSGYKTIKIESASRSHASEGVFQNDKMTKYPYDPLLETFDREESYWQGEEFRKQTPILSEEVYKKIPNFLRQCQLQEVSLRERDLLLLSCLTSLSAMMPQTGGLYNYRLYSPHLYTFCLAPAGSGKAIAQWGAKLLYTLHKHVFQQSEQKAEEYKRERQEWLMEHARKVKQKEQATPKEEPKEPPFRSFVIPATTSNTRLQLQLRDNGVLGGIIFDTEARTMTNANQLDCGHFDDILCKAFGHEIISSSYKANGMKPIVVYNPLLAVFLTGTPEQLSHLLESPESGLSSRFLFYTYRDAPVWKEMGQEGYDMDECFERHSQEAFRIYQFCQANPLRFSFSRTQWDSLNRTFGRLLAEVVSESSDHLQAVVKRYAFITMRVAMILTRLERYEHGLTEPGCECTQDCFDTALSLVLCCYEHSRLLFTSIPVKNRYCLKDPDQKRKMFEELSTDFTLEDVRRLSATFSFSERTAIRYITQLMGLKVKRISHGVYKKL